MPEAAAAGTGDNGAAAGQGTASGTNWKSMLQTIIRSMVMYYMISSFMKPKAPAAPHGGDVTAAGTASDSTVAAHTALNNVWRPGTPMDLHVALSTEALPVEEAWASGSVIWREHGLFYLPDDGERSKSLTLQKDQLPSAWENQTIYAHIVFTRNGVRPDDGKAKNALDMNYVVYPVVRHFFEKKADERVNLISGEAKDNEQVERGIAQRQEGRRVLPHWMPELSIRTIFDFTTYNPTGVPPQIAKDIRVTPEGGYFAPIHIDTFFMTKQRMVQINETVESLTLDLHYSPMAAWKWQLSTTMQMSFDMHTEMGSMGEGESDEIKRILTEGNPILLVVTGTVSMLHTVFDFLAFKNDIKFWKDVKTMQGISVRTIFVNVFCQGVIFLYLLDHETSWMIIISSGVGLVIEAWKIKKACKVTIDRTGSIPKIRVENYDSYTNETLRYDELAMYHLAAILYPAAVGLAAYSLIYSTHKSYYSWLLSSLVTFVQVFGFISMTPQLFINYKLKSVAHLPWRAMTYKFLNTIIDDLFAFVVKMPILYRIGVFRDDLVFLVYLYQRWIYRVDMTRTNEFGQSFAGDEVEGDEQPKEGSSEGSAQLSEDSKGSAGANNDADAETQSSE